MRSRIESLGVSMPGGIVKMGSVDHAVAAGKRCLGSSKYGASDIETLINAGIFRDGHCGEPAMAAFVQGRLGINPSFGGPGTFSFDLANGGVGMLNALHVTDGLMKSGAIRVGMTVSSEVNTDRNPDPGYRYPRSGAAVILDRSPDSHRGFGSFVFKTFDGFSCESVSRVELFKKGGRLKIEKSVRLDESYLACARPVFDELLERENIERRDIDILLPSQISPEFIAGLAGALDIPGEKIIDVTGETGGDTHTTSPFMAMNSAMCRGLTNPGRKAVFLAVGSGITVGCAIYHF